MKKREVWRYKKTHLSSSSEYSILSLMELDKLSADFFLLPLILLFSWSNLYWGIFSMLPQWLPPWCIIDFLLPGSELCSELALIRLWLWCSKAGLSIPRICSLMETRLFISSSGLVLPVSFSISTVADHKSNAVTISLTGHENSFLCTSRLVFFPNLHLANIFRRYFTTIDVSCVPWPPFSINTTF